jgi:hypothetical protein
MGKGGSSSELALDPDGTGRDGLAFAFGLDATLKKHIYIYYNIVQLDCSLMGRSGALS